MAFHCEDKDGTIHVTIDGKLSIYEAPTLRDQIQQCFRKPEDLILDLGGVTECDIAGVQFLVSVRATAQMLGKTLAVLSASEPITAIMERSGLDPSVLFETPMED